MNAPLQSIVEIEPAFIHTDPAARLLGIPKRTFLDYVARGIVPSYKLGRHRLFRKSELLECMNHFRQAAIGEVLK